MGSLSNTESVGELKRESTESCRFQLFPFRISRSIFCGVFLDAVEALKRFPLEKIPKNFNRNIAVTD